MLDRLQRFEAYIPPNFLQLDNLLYAFLIVSLVVFGRYLLTVSFFYLLFWKLCIFDNIFKRLHSTKLQSTQWVHEIKWSIFSSLIFAISAIVMATLWSKGHTQIYLKLDEYPVWYHFLSFLILTLIHEIYFYATHIWMHRPQVFRKIHSIHHYSVETSPWTSFSFHPIEAAVHAAFIPIFVILIPVHPITILVYLIFMTITAISNHSGIELIPSKKIRTYFISGTHHHLHHTRINFNFGLYFTLIDKLFKTEYTGRNH